MAATESETSSLGKHLVEKKKREIEKKWLLFNQFPLSDLLKTESKSTKQRIQIVDDQAQSVIAELGFKVKNDGCFIKDFRQTNPEKLMFADDFVNSPNVFFCADQLVMIKISPHANFKSGFLECKKYQKFPTATAGFQIEEKEGNQHYLIVLNVGDDSEMDGVYRVIKPSMIQLWIRRDHYVLRSITMRTVMDKKVINLMPIEIDSENRIDHSPLSSASDFGSHSFSFIDDLI